MLEKICLGAAISGGVLDSYLEFCDLFWHTQLPSISPYIGDWKHILNPALFLSMYYGKKYADQIRVNKTATLADAAKIPKAVTAATTIYFALGETILPQILPGTADVNDLPAVFLAGITTYFAINPLIELWN